MIAFAKTRSEDGENGVESSPVETADHFGCATASTRKAAHVVPLGQPHDGDDVASNILCLCPNDHVLLDTGGIFITDTLEVFSAVGASLGTLRTLPSHTVDLLVLLHRRKRFGL